MAMLQAQAAGRGDPFCTLEDEWLLWLAELNDDVESVVIVPVDGWAAPLADDALLGALQDAQRALASAQSDWLTLVGQAARSQVTDRVENMPIESWLAAGTSHSTRAAKADVRLARQLAEQACVADALGSGALSREQAEAITQGLDRLPDELDRGQRDAVAAHLVQLAVEFGPTALRKLVNHAVEVVAPEVAEAADRTALERAEREQQRTRYVAWRTDAPSSTSGTMPDAHASLRACPAETRASPSTRVPTPSPAARSASVMVTTTRVWSPPFAGPPSHDAWWETVAARASARAWA